MQKMVWSVVGLLVLSWIVGVIFKIAEGVIHVLLIIAAALGIFNLTRGRSSEGPATG